MRHLKVFISKITLFYAFLSLRKFQQISSLAIVFRYLIKILSLWNVAFSVVIQNHKWLIWLTFVNSYVNFPSFLTKFIPCCHTYPLQSDYFSYFTDVKGVLMSIILQKEVLVWFDFLRSKVPVHQRRWDAYNINKCHKKSS